MRMRHAAGRGQDLAQPGEAGERDRPAGEGGVSDQRQAERGEGGDARDRREAGTIEYVGHRSNPGGECERISEEGQQADDLTLLIARPHAPDEGDDAQTPIATRTYVEF